MSNLVIEGRHWKTCDGSMRALWLATPCSEISRISKLTRKFDFTSDNFSSSKIGMTKMWRDHVWRPPGTSGQRAMGDATHFLIQRLVWFGFRKDGGKLMAVTASGNMITTGCGQLFCSFTPTRSTLAFYCIAWSAGRSRPTWSAWRMTLSAWGITWTKWGIKWSATQRKKLLHLALTAVNGFVTGRCRHASVDLREDLSLF